MSAGLVARLAFALVVASCLRRCDMLGCQRLRLRVLCRRRLCGLGCSCSKQRARRGLGRAREVFVGGRARLLVCDGLLRRACRREHRDILAIRRHNVHDVAPAVVTCSPASGLGTLAATLLRNHPRAAGIIAVQQAPP